MSDGAATGAAPSPRWLITASGEDASVSGGYDNTASGRYASVGGGHLLEALADYEFLP